MTPETTPPAERHGLLLSSDLMFSSRLTGTARALGRTVQVIGSQQAAIESAPGAALLLVDLDSAGVEITALMSALREMDDRPLVMAFGPHVKEARLAEAREAGCDQVFSRGQMHRELERLLGEHLQ